MSESLGRLCNKCGEYKPWSEYYTAERGLNGKTARCKQCIKKYEASRYATNSERMKAVAKRGRLKRWYGITVQQLWDMLDAQMDQCAICGRDFKNDKDTHVDHNHSTGKVRGLLCLSCNVMLGNAKDDVTILKSAIDYLERHSND